MLLNLGELQVSAAQTVTAAAAKQAVSRLVEMQWQHALPAAAV
jgi:hypothetical protein